MDNFQLYYLCHPDTDEVRYGCNNKIVHKYVKKHNLYVK